VTAEKRDGGGRRLDVDGRCRARWRRVVLVGGGDRAPRLNTAERGDSGGDRWLVGGGKRAPVRRTIVDCYCPAKFISSGSLYIGKYAYPRGRENVHRNHLEENYKRRTGAGKGNMLIFNQSSGLVVIK
jgi:hypothetical protein